MTVLDTRPWGKGKERALLVDENDGGSSGVVLSMDMVWTSYYAVAYIVPVQLGSSQQNFSLQVDTGSSDLWVASKSCSSAPCSATGGRLYDPSSSQSTGATLTMQYLAGAVGGPIVWDQVQIGGYTIPNQALAAATTVSSEPLSYGFDGVLGLALPLNSLIQQTIPASTGDAPDGAALSSNLFSLTPAANAPSKPFFSLALARPGSGQIPSLLGIGRHPPEIISDPSQIRYSPLVSETIGTLFWKTTVRAITVYVNGQAHPVVLQSLSGASEPTALLDSGVPVIVTTPTLANGIYGALGIGPASDGNYYVPCATPLNITITLGGQNELPLHPLDLTTEPAGQSDSQYCMGLIQTDPSQLTATSDIGDMILGVPFMRNVYTVMAYEQPDATGSFNNSVTPGANPSLGLLGLTNATRAMEEFHQVRVLKQPLGGGSSQPSASSRGGGPKLSIGIEVLIGLLGFFVLCLALFALRYLLARRRWRQTTPVVQEEDVSDQKMKRGGYQRTRSHSQSSVDQSTLNYASSLHKSESASRYVNNSGPQARVRDEEDLSEFGVRRSDSPTETDIWDPWAPFAGTWRGTIVGTYAGESASPRSSNFSHSLANPGSQDESPERELTSVSLMAYHEQSASRTSSDLAEVGVRSFSVSMAGVGTVTRGSVISAALQHDRPSHDSTVSRAPS